MIVSYVNSSSIVPLHNYSVECWVATWQAQENQWYCNTDIIILSENCGKVIDRQSYSIPSTIGDKWLTTATIFFGGGGKLRILSKCRGETYFEAISCDLRTRRIFIKYIKVTAL